MSTPSCWEQTSLQNFLLHTGHSGSNQINESDRSSLPPLLDIYTVSSLCPSKRCLRHFYARGRVGLCEDVMVLEHLVC